MFVDTVSSVTSSLYYCNMLCMGLPLETVQKLQQVQNAVPQATVGREYRDYINPEQNKLSWLPRPNSEYRSLPLGFWSKQLGARNSKIHLLLSCQRS